MNRQTNHSSFLATGQVLKSNNLVNSNQWGREEVLSASDLKARYLLQLYLMLRTARRAGYARVVTALRGLIAYRRGIG